LSLNDQGGALSPRIETLSDFSKVAILTEGCKLRVTYLGFRKRAHSA
jgi:hypothetical protein